ncbi:hypothetical protein D3C72_1027670 [compost metagenome]
MPIKTPRPWAPWVPVPSESPGAVNWPIDTSVALSGPSIAAPGSLRLRVKRKSVSGWRSLPATKSCPLMNKSSPAANVA